MPMKYELVSGDTVQQDGKTLTRIRRLADGQLGGYIETQDNLAQTGSCWVFGDSRAYGNARIGDNAELHGTAHDDAIIGGDGQVHGEAFGQSQVLDHAFVRGRVFDQAVVKGFAEVNGQAFGHSVVQDHAKVFGQIFGSATATGNEIVFGSKGP